MKSDRGVHMSAGEAEAIFARAEATAKGIRELSKAIRNDGGAEVRSSA